MTNNILTFPKKEEEYDQLKEVIESCSTGVLFLQVKGEPLFYFLGEEFNPSVAYALVNRGVDGLSSLVLEGAFEDET